MITTPHPRLANYPPRIYREGPIGDSRGHRALYLASPLAEPKGTYQIPTINHVRTMGLPENKPPPGSSGRTPYFFTSRNNQADRPLAETKNIGRYTNRRPRPGPQLRFQFELQMPQQPPRPVSRPEPVVEILEEDGTSNEVQTESETNEDEEMEMLHLNSAALF